MAKKLLVAANIHSGAGAVRENLASIIDFCVSRGFAVSVRTSQCPILRSTAGSTASF